MTKCPLCNFTFGERAQFLQHILENHDKTHFYLNQLVHKDGNCHFCGEKIAQADSISHVTSCHADKALLQISKKPLYKPKSHQEKLSPFISQLVNNKQPQKTQQQSPGQKRKERKPQMKEEIATPINEEEEENDEYVRFIASSIAASGLDIESVEIGPIKPVKVDEPKGEKPNSIQVNEEFWNSLDKIDAAMQMDGQIEYDEDNESIVCKKCGKSFSTLSRLFQHYWESHKDMLSKFTTL